MPGSRRGRDVDLAASRLPAISWDKKIAGLSELSRWAEELAQEAIDWYLGEKKRKARWSRSLRLLAAILIILGGAVPLAALTSDRAALGNWGFVLIGLSAGCLAYDRFCGFSSAWLRYMATAVELRSQLSDFQLEWVRGVAAFRTEEPSQEATLKMIDAVQTFIRGVNETIRSETQSWLDEFHANLSELRSKVDPGSTSG